MPTISIEQAKKEKLFYVVASAVVYRKTDGKCLLLKRSMREKVYPGRWALPGGKLEWNDLGLAVPGLARGDEAVLDHVIERLLAREIKEESGVDVAPTFQYLDSRSFVRPDGIPVILLKFGALYAGGEVRLEEGAFTNHAWVDTSDVRSYDCLEGIPEEIHRTIAHYRS